MQERETTSVSPVDLSPQGEEQRPYLYRQALPRQEASAAPSQPQRIRRLLDELRQTKLDLQEARRQAANLELRLLEAESAKRALTEQMRYLQQLNSQWRKRLRQTETLLKRVFKQPRDLSR